MKKIGFCDRYGLTNAVLTGTKTMTRRIEKGVESPEDANNTRYKLGEVVAVAQSYKSIHTEMMNGDYGESMYDAFRCYPVSGTKGWNNKMFVRPDLMPHQIKIKGVRIERLQYIIQDDCLKEGINCHYDSQGHTYYYVKGINAFYYSPRVIFATLINSPGVGRKGLWESNPYVVVYEFELVK